LTTGALKVQASEKEAGGRNIADTFKVRRPAKPAGVRQRITDDDDHNVDWHEDSLITRDGLADLPMSLPTTEINVDEEEGPFTDRTPERNAGFTGSLKTEAATL
jgi:hypothetical protein